MLTEMMTEMLTEMLTACMPGPSSRGVSAVWGDCTGALQACLGIRLVHGVDASIMMLVAQM